MEKEKRTKERISRKEIKKFNKHVRIWGGSEFPEEDWVKHRRDHVKRMRLV